MADFYFSRVMLPAIQHLHDLAGQGRPVSLAVTDDAGRTVLVYRMPGAGARSTQMALGKAYTAGKMAQSTADFHARLQRENLGLADFMDAGFTSLAGGVPLCDPQGECVGGLAISGLAPMDDDAMARKMKDFVESAAMGRP
ncbi:heme-binding protein [Desulfovibrio sp. OttesenSCG-928-C06]|nr:heme-binding protein [Desulfovibrio sp. OttesenSCG-928-C06]